MKLEASQEAGEHLARRPWHQPTFLARRRASDLAGAPPQACSTAQFASMTPDGCVEAACGASGAPGAPPWLPVHRARVGSAKQHGRADDVGRGRLRHHALRTQRCLSRAPQRARNSNSRSSRRCNRRRRRCPPAPAAMAALPQLWVPAAVLAHAFALAFLLRALQLVRPGLWARARRWLLRCGPAAPPPPMTAGVAADSIPSISSSSSSSSSCITAGRVQLQRLSLSHDSGGTAIGTATRLARSEGSEGSFGSTTSTTSLSKGHISSSSSITSSEGDAAALVVGPPPPAAGLKLLAKGVQAPARLEWRGVSCTYSTSSGGGKRVLDGVWGEAAAYEMQALLGPSGAGKSTLLDVLAARKATGTVSGAILLGGQPLAATASGAAAVAYVSQEDAFLPLMTATEVLTVQAAMLIPARAGSRQAAVDDVLQAMGLTRQAHTLVGGSLPGGLLLRGLSGGERKRLHIAAGLLAAPGGCETRLLLLDEPTSGLDSFAALSVMGHLQRLCRAGALVLVAIHQPRSAIWKLFDKVTLLASSLLIYHGSTEGMVPWLAGSLGYAADSSQLASDWALDLVTVEFGGKQQLLSSSSTMTSLEQLQAAAAAFKDHYMRSHAGLVEQLAVMVAEPEAPSLPAPGQQRRKHWVRQLLPCVSPPPAPFAEAGHATGGASTGYPTGWWRQARVLAWRELLKLTRNPADVAGRTLTFTWVALLVGLYYYDLPEDANSIRQRLNLLFASCCFFLLMPFISQSIFSDDKGLFMKEQAAQLYRPSAHYAAKAAMVLPFNVMLALSYSCVQYGLTGMRPGASVVARHCTLASLMSLIATQVLQLATMLTSTQDAAFMMGISWTCMNMVMSGYFIRVAEVKFAALANLRVLSALQYAFEGLAQLELGGRAFPCPPAGGDSAATAAFLAQLLPQPAGQLPPALLQQLVAAGGSSRRGGGACTVDSSALTSQFGFSRSFAQSAGILAGYLAALHVASFAAVMLVARRRERR